MYVVDALDEALQIARCRTRIEGNVADVNFPLDVIKSLNLKSNLRFAWHGSPEDADKATAEEIIPAYYASVRQPKDAPPVCRVVMEDDIRTVPISSSVLTECGIENGSAFYLLATGLDNITADHILPPDRGVGSPRGTTAAITR